MVPGLTALLKLIWSLSKGQEHATLHHPPSHVGRSRCRWLMGPGQSLPALPQMRVSSSADKPGCLLCLGDSHEELCYCLVFQLRSFFAQHPQRVIFSTGGFWEIVRCNISKHRLSSSVTETRLGSFHLRMGVRRLHYKLVAGSGIFTLN